MAADPELEAEVALLLADSEGLGFNGIHPVMGQLVPGTRISVHGRPGSTSPSRPLTLRGRSLLPFRRQR